MTIVDGDALGDAVGDTVGEVPVFKLFAQPVSASSITVMAEALMKTLTFIRSPYLFDFSSGNKKAILRLKQINHPEGMFPRPRCISERKARSE